MEKTFYLVKVITEYQDGSNEAYTQMYAFNTRKQAKHFCLKNNDEFFVKQTRLLCGKTHVLNNCYYLNNNKGVITFACY